MKKLLNVPPVGFDIGDRAPESLAFPACMTSLMQYLGEDYPDTTLRDRSRTYTYRTGNHQFLAASGMAFALLWSDALCPSSTDVMQAVGHAEAIRRGFAWAGWSYDVVQGAQADIKPRIVASIDRDVPVLTFNVFGIPECELICGYENGGDALLGWADFADESACRREAGGLLRREGWQDDIWMAVIPDRRVGRSLAYDEILRFGAEIMEKTEADGYRAGQAAYARWIDVISNCGDLDDEGLRALHGYHHLKQFHLAELRCWGGDFVKNDAGKCFKRIHDLCWEMNAVAGRTDWKALRSGEVRQNLAEKLRKIAALDAEALEILKNT